jgi:hypothetical protein
MPSRASLDPGRPGTIRQALRNCRNYQRFPRKAFALSAKIAQVFSRAGEMLTLWQAGNRYLYCASGVGCL